MTIDAEESRTSKEMHPYKKQVLELLRAIETGEQGPISVIDNEKYVQHNVLIGDGIEGFAVVMKELRKYTEPAKVDVRRIYQDRNYVFTHTSYNFFGRKVGFDVFRFENDRIVEHWDNLQEDPQKENPSGHTMIDGSVALLDKEKTQININLVYEFINDILMGNNPGKLTLYFDGDHFIQHNPMFSDGLSGFGKALKWMDDHGITLRYNRVEKILGEGNFVLAISEGLYGPNGGELTAIYDLFRVEQDKIAEHWDTITRIPDKQDWKNNNGKFNFK